MTARSHACPLLPAAPTADALVRLGRSGDPAAWHWLVDAHGDRIHALVGRIVGAGAAADDACQEAFLQLRRDSRRFRPHLEHPEAAAVSWLLRLATSTALAWLRATRRRQRRETPVASLPERPQDPQDGPDPRWAILDAALDDLPARHRLVVHLRFHAGLAAEDLGLALGASAATARVRLHRAMTLLRQRCARAGLPLESEVLGMLLVARALPAGTAPQATLHALADQPLRRVAPIGTGVLAVLAGGAVAVLTLTLALDGSAARRVTAVAPALPGPAPAPAVPVLPLTGDDLLRLRVHLEFSETPLAEVCEFCTRVLRVPLRMAPALARQPPDPVTLMEDQVSVVQTLQTLASLTGTAIAVAPTGGWEFTNVTSPAGAFSPPPAYVLNDRDRQLEQALVLQGDPVIALRQVEAPCCPNPAALASLTVLDARPVLVPLAAGTPLAVVHEVLTTRFGVPVLPHDRGCAVVWKGRWPAMPLAQALARIQAVAGLPCRIDALSGPMPWVARATDAPILVGDLLAQLAEAAHARCTQAADGMVFYRPPSLTWADGEESRRDPQTNTPYQGHLAPWWWATATFTRAHPVVVEQVPLDLRLLDIAWPAGTRVADAATDLARQLGVPLWLEEAAGPVPLALVLPGRRAGVVLAALNAGSRCSWTIEAGCLHVQRRRAPEHEPPADPAPPSGTPATLGGAGSEDQVPAPAPPPAPVLRGPPPTHG